MMRRTSNAPEWAKILFQELTKPPQFLAGILEDQKQKLGAQPTQGTSQSQTQQSQQTQESSSNAAAQESYSAGTSYTNQQSDPASRAENAHQSTVRSGAAAKPQRRSKPSRSGQNKDKRDVVEASLQQVSKTSNGSAWRQVLQDANIPQSAIKEYGWKVTKANYAGTAVRVQTSNNSYAIKESSINPQRIQFLQSALRYARQHGFIRGPRFALTKQKHPYAVEGNKVFYATKWVEGRPVRFTNNQDVGKVARALAEFHESTRGFESASYNPPMEFDLNFMTKRRYEDLKMMLAEADGRTSRGTFDKLLLNAEEQLRKDAEESLELLEDSDVQDFLLHDEYQAGLCHLDVIPSNFIYDKSDTVHLLDLDLCTYAPRVLDIAHLLRRSLQLQEWNSEAAYTSFVNFEKVAPITREEYLIIQSLLTFPYKVWRLTHTRFRLFPEAAQVDELKRYLRQEDSRHKFLRALRKQISS